MCQYISLSLSLRVFEDERAPSNSSACATSPHRPEAFDKINREDIWKIACKMLTKKTKQI